MLPGMTAFPCPGSCGVGRSWCGCGFRFQHFHHLVGCGGGGVFLEKAGNNEDRVTHAGFRHAIWAAVCGAGGAVLFIGHRQLLSFQQFFQSVQLGFCGFLSEILCREADRGTHFNQSVIDTGVGGVLRVFQHIRRVVGGDDQRLAAAVSAVNHIVDLL